MTKSRTKLRKNCGPKLVERVRNITYDLFRECDAQSREEIPFPSDDIVKEIGLGDYIDKIRGRASELYQERIKTLPTKDLEDILWVHECGKYRRAPSTLEGIIGELAKRQLFK